MRGIGYSINKIVLLLLVVAIGWGVKVFVFPSADRQLAAMADDYFDNYYFPNHPTSATSAGIHRYDSQLEDYTKAGIAREISQLTEWEKRFAAVDASKLSVHAQDNLSLLLSSIRSSLLSLKTIRPWEKNPDVYSSGITNSAFVIISRKFASNADRMRSLIAREKKMPAVLRAAKKNLHNPPRVFTEVAIEQLPGMIHFFEKDVPQAFASVTDPELKKEFKASNAGVIQALRDYQEWLNEDLLPQSSGDFRIGKKTFQKKLLLDEMVDTPLNNLLEMNLADMRKNQEAFKRVAKALDPNKTPRQVLAMLAKDHPKADKILDNFKGTFDELVQFIKEKHIITIPSDVRPILEETPPFLRAITFASMDTPGPYERNATEAYFNVTLPSAGWDQRRKDGFLALFNYPVISNISVHEAYPGHYVQFLWMHHVDDRVRKLLGASSNAEGWAHYCEQMMLDEGFGANRSAKEVNLLRLGQLQNALLRNARFVVGIKLHTGKMTMDQARAFFINEGYQSPMTGVVETKRATFDPLYLYYTLGKLQIMELRDAMKAKEGRRFSLEKFHNEFMQHGFAPIKIVAREMLS